MEKNPVAKNEFAGQLFEECRGMVETIKFLFEGSCREIWDNRTKSLNLKAAQQEINAKIILAQQLIALQKKISQNPEPEEMKTAFDKLWKEVFPETDPPAPSK